MGWSAFAQSLGSNLSSSARRPSAPAALLFGSWPICCTISSTVISLSRSAAAAGVRRGRGVCVSELMLDGEGGVSVPHASAE